MRAPTKLIAVSLCLLGFSTACGASLGAIYEGDVRFEHCMALDYRRDVKPTIRRACWREWVRFYTFGQTRDRVEYAENRIRQLRNASDFAEVEDPAPTNALTEPTSALAPPPRVIVADAGARQPEPDEADAQAPTGPIEPACAVDCDAAREVCIANCATPACKAECDERNGQCREGCR